MACTLVLYTPPGGASSPELSLFENNYPKPDTFRSCGSIASPLFILRSSKLKRLRASEDSRYSEPLPGLPTAPQRLSNVPGGSQLLSRRLGRVRHWHGRGWPSRAPNAFCQSKVCVQIDASQPAAVFGACLASVEHASVLASTR